MLSRSAQEFIGAVTFEALTGRRVFSELVAAGHALDHIKLAQSADAVIVAPATADFWLAPQAAVCRLVRRRAPGYHGSVLLVPAMNDRMLAHPQTCATWNTAELGYGGWNRTGPLASEKGERPGSHARTRSNPGTTRSALESSDLCSQKRRRIRGPAREPVDAVRYVSNRSSGRWAWPSPPCVAPWRRFVLVHGPLVSRARWCASVTTETTEQMPTRLARIRLAQVLVMAAAHRIFVPRKPIQEDQKVRQPQHRARAST